MLVCAANTVTAGEHRFETTVRQLWSENKKLLPPVSRSTRIPAGLPSAIQAAASTAKPPLDNQRRESRAAWPSKSACSSEEVPDASGYIRCCAPLRGSEEYPCELLPRRVNR